MKKSSRGADKVVAKISSQLSSKKLKLGDKLPTEAALCKKFDVSRTVIREALQQLKAIGVLKTITGSGSYITEGSLDGLKNSLEFYTVMTGDTDSWIELLEVRALLESGCARKLAGDNFSEEGLKEIKKALQKMADNKDDVTAFSELDVLFHQALIKASGNKISAVVLKSLEKLQYRFARETYRDENSEQLIERNYREHLSIVEAIEDRDPDAAETAMKLHISETLKNLNHFIKNS